MLPSWRDGRSLLFSDSGLESRREKPGSRKLRPDVFIVVVASIAAALLMTHSLAAKSLWIDETLSITYSRQSLRDLFPFFIHGEMNMALYHLLLHFWLRLGESETVVRSLSVIFAVGAIPFGFATCARLFSRRVGVLAAILLTLNGAYYSYGRDARSYSLAVFLVIAASYFVVEAVITGRRSFWVGYVVTGALSVYAHFFALFVLGAHLLSVLFGWSGRDERRGAIVASAAVFVLSIPALAYIATGDTSKTTDPEVSLRDVPNLFRWYATNNRPLLAIYAVGAVAGIASSVSLLRRGYAREAWPQLFLLAWLSTPVVGALLVSYTIDPMFQPRYLLVSLPALVFLAARGISIARPLVTLVVLTAVVTAVSFRALHLCEPGCSTPTQDFRAATAFIQNHAAPADQILFNPPYLQTAYDYYARARRSGRGSEDPGDKSDRVASARRVWLLTDAGDPNRQNFTSLVRELERRRELLLSKRFPGMLRVTLYARGTASRS